MSEQNKALMRCWFEEVWNKGRAEAIDEMFADDGVAHGLAEDGKELRGPTAFKPFFHSFRTAFPDIKVTIEDAIAEKDKVVVRCRVRGTHRGDGINVAATDLPVDFTGICITRINDGKIVEAWNNFDFMGMFQQIGAITLAANAPPSKS